MHFDNDRVPELGVNAKIDVEKAFDTEKFINHINTKAQ